MMTNDLDFYNAQLQVKHREVWNSPWIVDHAVIWMQNLDLSINEKLLSDIANGYEGGFDNPVSGYTKDEFLSKYDDVIYRFLDRWNELLHDPKFSDVRPGDNQPALGNPQKKLAWNRIYKRGEECKLHNHTDNVGKIAFSAVHFLKLDKDHPQLYFQLGPERIDILDFKENDVVIFPSIIPHGVDPNPLDSERIAFIFDFTVDIV